MVLKKINENNLNIKKNLKTNDNFNFKYDINYQEEFNFRKAETSKIFDQFKDDYKKLFVEKSRLNNLFLKKHNIDSLKRAKLIDWLIEVCHYYKCSDRCFFLVLDIMDLYLYKTNKIYTNYDLHLLSLTSLYISAKLEEVLSFQSFSIYSKIGFNKFTKSDLLKKEFEIWTTLNFRLFN